MGKRAHPASVAIGLLIGIMILLTLTRCTAEKGDHADPIPEADTIYDAYYLVYRFVDKEYGSVCYAWNESLFCMEVGE